MDVIVSKPQIDLQHSSSDDEPESSFSVLLLFPIPVMYFISVDGYKKIYNCMNLISFILKQANHRHF